MSNLTIDNVYSAGNLYTPTDARNTAKLKKSEKKHLASLKYKYKQEKQQTEKQT